MGFAAMRMLILYCTFHSIHAAHILGLPLPFRSHSIAMIRLLEDVKSRHGHTSTMVLPDYFINDGFMKKQNLSYFIARNYSKVNIPELEKMMANSGFVGDTGWEKIIFHDASVLCHSLLTDNDLIKELKTQKFDIAIIDNFINCPCISVLPYKLNTPYIHFGRIMDAIALRLPFSLSTSPAWLFYDFTNPFTFTDRLVNVLFYHLMEIVPYSVNVENAVEIYAPEKPYLSKHEMKARAEIELIDRDILMDWPFTTLPNTVLVGGITTGPAKPLSGDLANFMDKGTGGVVIISFGSIVTSLPDRIIAVLRETFQKMKDTFFVVKVSEYMFKEENVFSLDWLPQNDLLGHKNCKVFITHCGNRGQFEALYHGVPMIGLPLFGDQIYNARRMKMRGYGTYLHISKITSEDLVKAIEEVMTNPDYNTNIRKASEIFRNRPQTPAEKAAFWVDHTIKFGGKHLRSSPPDQPYYQHRLLDVYGFILLCLLLIFAVFYKLIFQILKLMRKVKKKQE